MLERITVRNFVTYEKADIDLTGKHAIAVYGDNGAGKTTLFVDAVTFALYGRTAALEHRGVSRADLIMPGKPHASVRLVLSIAGERYEVYREVSRTGATKLTVSKLVGGRTVLLASGAAEAGRYIAERLLGMSYDTFISTVVIRQGEVERFSEMTPSERRHTLLEAFGLSLEKAREALREKLSSTRVEKAKVAGELEHLERELKKLPEAEAALKEAESKLSEARREAEEAEAQLKEAKAMEMELEKKRLKLAREKAKLEEALARARELEEKIREARGELEKLAKLTESEQGLTEELKKAEARRSMLEEMLKLKREEMEAERELKPRIASLESDLRSIDLRIQRLKAKLEGRREAELEAEEARKAAEEAKEVEKELKRTREERDMAQRELEAIRRKKLELKLFLDDLAKGELKECPLCFSQIPEDRLQHIAEVHRKELSEIESRELLEQARLRKADEAARRTEQRLRKLLDRAAKLKLLEERLKEIKEAEEELEKLAASRELAEAQLASARRQLEERLKAIREEASRRSLPLEVDARTLEAQAKAAAELEASIRLKLEKAREAKARAEERGRELANLELQLAEARKAAEALKPAEAEYEAVARELEEVRRRRAQLEEKLAQARQKQAKLTQMAEDLRKRIAELRRMEAKAEEARRKLSELSEREEVYTILRDKVFHDRGLPLELLKTQIEALNAHVQHYLDSFTGGAFRINLNTTDQGEVEVSVYDEAKMRPIHTFSAGEKTMLGFSLRLGLMKTIAQAKAAKPLGLLIVDEGFSSLDQDKRSTLGAIISSLTREFNMIVAISHLPEIRDYFPHSIKVEKKEGKSKATPEW